jgi:electron transport complex protein RnfG
MRPKITPKAILIPTISLFLICVVVTALLAVTNNITAEKIAANEAQSKQESMFSVVPDAASFEEIETDVFYAGKDASGNIVGYAVSTSMNGYGGLVKVMTGFDANGVILGVDVFYNDDETPGLGKNTSNASFRDQYAGFRSDENIVVSKDADADDFQTVDAVTSATISSRAVTGAVNKACAVINIYFSQNNITKEAE